MTESGADVPLSDTGADEGIVEQIVASVEGHGIRISFLSFKDKSSVIVGEDQRTLYWDCWITNLREELVSVGSLASALIETPISGAHFIAIKDSLTVICIYNRKHWVLHLTSLCLTVL